jgi:hypothetical protein
MQAGGVTNEGSLRSLSQSLFDIHENAQVIFFLQTRPFFNLELVSQNRYIRTGIIRNDFQIVSP